MEKKENFPWASGPGEILRHGTELLRKDSDTNRRLAMISIDNAVELMIKTYLGLPSRITGLTIPRKEYQDFSQSFPQLLDALEKYASEKIVTISIGEIEWYHRLRNELYHEGNGLTVERDKVTVYAELANLLFENLFGFRLAEPGDDKAKLLGEFLENWINLENLLKNLAGSPDILGHNYYKLLRDNLTPDEIDQLNSFKMIRNEVVHRQPKEILNAKIVQNLERFTRKISGKIEREK